MSSKIVNSSGLVFLASICSLRFTAGLSTKGYGNYSQSVGWQYFLGIGSAKLRQIRRSESAGGPLLENGQHSVARACHHTLYAFCILGIHDVLYSIFNLCATCN